MDRYLTGQRKATRRQPDGGQPGSRAPGRRGQAGKCGSHGTRPANTRADLARPESIAQERDVLLAQEGDPKVKLWQEDVEGVLLHQHFWKTLTEDELRIWTIKSLFDEETQTSQHSAFFKSFSENKDVIGVTTSGLGTGIDINYAVPISYVNYALKSSSVRTEKSIGFDAGKTQISNNDDAECMTQLFYAWAVYGLLYEINRVGLKRALSF